MNILAVYKHKTVMRHCFPFLKRASYGVLFFS
nr:MAG TPA: 5-aminolevulinate synthase [Caudoviricetes sp.]